MHTNPQFMFFIIVLGTILGLAGTDLVLPAIPSLPDTISGTLPQAQLVLAAFTGGTAAGLLFFGEVGARHDQRLLLIAALAGYCVFSAVSALCTTIPALMACRVAQGFVAAAPAVFAPGMIRALFDERRALRALGLMGSIESMVPALAPVAGAWLLTWFDWRASFVITAVLAAMLAVLWLILPSGTMNFQANNSRGPERQGYISLLRSAVFMRYAVSQACTLGGLLIFVFGAPTVITIGMGGTLYDFVTMQVIGISLFVLAANTAHHLVDRLGPEQTIWFGSGLAAAGSIAIAIYSLATSSPDPRWLWFLFAFVNLGLGFRGPPGFYRAIVASSDNDARGAALVMLAVFLTTAAGTAALAPFISLGLQPLAIGAAIVSTGSVVTLLLLPGLPD